MTSHGGTFLLLGEDAVGFFSTGKEMMQGLLRARGGTAAENDRPRHALPTDPVDHGRSRRAAA
jgi:hypothetical protein